MDFERTGPAGRDGQPASAPYRGHTIYVAVIGVEGEYQAAPIVCDLGDPPHAKTARRLRVEKTFVMRAQAQAYGFAAARAWFDYPLLV